MLFARARHSDLDRAETLRQDWSASGAEGFVECSVLNPKQAKASARANRLLPLVAPVQGVCDKSWASGWLASRQAWNLRCQGSLQDSPLLPALAANGKLLPCNLTSSETTQWLRSLLSSDPNAQAERVLQVRSHSLKATLLSWSAKASLDLQDRTLLGYHSLGLSRSALTYSRDALSGPLRALCTLLEQVRSGAFDPDNTRSGRWASGSAPSGQDAVPDGTKALAAPTTEPSEESDSSSSTCASSDSDQAEQVLLGTSHLLSLVAGNSEFCVSMNTRSGVLHVARRESDRFLCGRSALGLYFKETFESQESRLCQVCSHVSEGILDGKWAKPR